MSTEDTLYSFRMYSPELIERGRDNLVKAPIYLDGALAVPSSGTVSVFDDSNTAIIDAAAVTVVASVAQYNITAAAVASLALSEEWRIEWALLMPDGVVHTFRRGAALVRRRLYPVATDLDLLALHSDLTALRPSNLSSYQDYLDTAWKDIICMLREVGNFPNLVMSPSAFRRCHVYLTLELIARDFSTSFGDGSKWDLLADTYSAKFEAAYNRLNFQYDVDDDGQIDGRTRAAAPAIWLGIGTGRRGGSWPQ